MIDAASDEPEGWTTARLGEGLVEDVQPGFACGAHNRGGNGTAHLRPMNVSIEGRIELSDVKYVPSGEVNRDERSLRAGDVLFNNTNSPELVGKTAHYGDSTPRAFSNHMTRIRCRSEALDPKFCALVLHHRWQSGHFAAICNNHVSQASISRTVLLDTAIPMPPLAEQRRIVARVETLLAQVQVARQRVARVPLLLKRFRQSVLAAAYTGRLTANWREAQVDAGMASELISQLGTMRRSAAAARESRPRIIDNVLPNVSHDFEVYEVPECWQWVDLRFLMSPDEAFCYGVVQPGKDLPDGNRLVRAGDLEHGSVNLANLRRIPRSVDREFERSRLRGGELLVTVVGAGIGECAIAPNTCAGFNIARAVAKLPIRDVPVKYVFHWLTSPVAYSWMFGEAREVARPTLNLEQLKTIPVPLAPLPEQHEIVRRVEALFKLADAIERRVAQAAARAERLTQAILAKAFRGELVPTEAELARAEGRDYEPASILLERIRNSRGEAEQQPKRRKKRETEATPQQAARLEYGQIVLDILLLLEAWGKPVSISVLEPALVLLRNDQARETLLRQKGKRRKASASDHGRKQPFVKGLDAVYEALERNEAVERVKQHAFRLLKPELVSRATEEDRRRVAEVVEAIQALKDVRDLPDIVAEVVDGRYEVVAAS